MLYLKAYHDDERLHEIELTDRTIRIGRGAECELVLADLSVSRDHAQIEPHGNFYLIRDNGSTNGTYVNDRAIEVEVLRPGDAIRIGKFVLKLDPAPGKRGDTSKIRIKALEALQAAGTEGSRRFAKLESGDDEGRAAHGSAHDRLVRLYEIQQQLGFVDSLPALLDRSLVRMLEELRGDRGCILLLDFKQKEAVTEPEDLQPASIAVRGCDPEEVGNEEELIVPEQLIRFLIEEKSAMLFTDEEGDEKFRAGEGHAVAAPFLARNRLIGLVYLQREAGGGFDEEDLQFLSLIASLVAVNLTNALLFEEIFAEKEKLQAVITGLSEGILVTDPGLKIIEASARAALLLGEEESLLGRNFLDLHKHFRFSMDRRLIHAEVSRGACRLRMERQRGGDQVLDVRITPFSGPVSGLEGRIVFLRDAAEDRNIEEKKAQFIRNIAHKLRTPLTVIEGNLPLLHGEIGKNAEAVEILDDVEKGSQALCGLVDDFVGFMEMELKNLQGVPATEVRKPADLTWEAINRVKGMAAEKRLLVNNKIPGDLPEVTVQPARFVQALARILENAVKFSPDGGIVAIEGERAEEVVRIHVIDDGPGIPAGEQEAVFQVLHQIDAQGAGEAPGLGLGLAIARQIVQEHGGDIQITSPFRSKHGGARVTVVLPVERSRVPASGVKGS